MNWRRVLFPKEDTIAGRDRPADAARFWHKEYQSVLTISGDTRRFCDRISRRGFMAIGAFGALTLSDILRLEASTPAGSRHKAVINIFLGGGPPHQDMWEIKTEAPREIRGEFKPIPTKVPGIQICEVFPRIAGLMDKCAVLRAVVGAEDRHDSHQCLSGWRYGELRSMGGHPCLGSVLAKLEGPVDLSVPPFVGLAKVGVWRNPGTPGFLGPGHAPFQPEGDGLADMKLDGITLGRLRDRRSLLASFDRFRRAADASGTMASMDSFGQRAFDVLTSSRLLEARDLSREDPRIVERYGDGKPYKYQYDGSPTVNDSLLVARRLVEAGVRCVTLTYGRWDSHGANFDLVRDHGSKLDQGLSALIEDLESRGMLDDTTVIAWGEFGRTPRINNDAGRDHWTPVTCALLAGGGIKTGQAIGATDRLGAYASERPVDFQEVFATLYHNLGIDPTTTALPDLAGRPQYLVTRPVIHELV